MHRILIIIELYWNKPIVAIVFSTSFCISDSNIAKMRNAQELPSIRLIVNISAHFTLTYPSKFCTLWVLNTFDSTSCSCHKGHFVPICDFKVFATCCMQHQENSRALSLKLQVAIICAHNYGISCTRTIKNILSSSPWKPHKSCAVFHSRANAIKNSKVMNALQAAERALTTLLSHSLSLAIDEGVCMCVCVCLDWGRVCCHVFYSLSTFGPRFLCSSLFLRLLSVIGWFYENWFGARPSEVASAAAAVSLARCKCQPATEKWQVTIVLYSIITYPKLMLYRTVQI